MSALIFLISIWKFTILYYIVDKRSNIIVNLTGRNFFNAENKMATFLLLPVYLLSLPLRFICKTEMASLFILYAILSSAMDWSHSNKLLMEGLGYYAIFIGSCFLSALTFLICLVFYLESLNKEGNDKESTLTRYAIVKAKEMNAQSMVLNAVVWFILTLIISQLGMLYSFSEVINS